MRRTTNRIIPLAAAAALALLGVVPAALPGRVAMAADRGLVVVAQTRYQALPAERRVHVTIDAVATSYTPNPVDATAYYVNATFVMQAGATNVAASSGGQRLAVAVDASDPDFVSVTVTFAEGVTFEQSYPYRVTYDLPDPGGAQDRNLRISSTIVAFPIWAFGSSGEPGGSVTVILPRGFRPSLQGDDLASSIGAGGEIVLATTSLPDPFDFFAYLSADRPGAFSDTLLTVQVGGQPAPLRIRAWQDDPEWGTAMTDLMTDGLPALQSLIGLPYDAPGTLVVEEAATSRLGDYAGIYNKLSGIIRVRYDADAYVGLHEAAHVWFNGDLFRDRWIGEAYAEFYGVQAALAIGATGDAFDLTEDLLANRIPLNDWGEIGGVEIGVEGYAYAASYHLAVLIFDRTDLAALRAVWRGASDSEMAYQPANADGDPEIAGDVNLEGWQQLLDLLDERAGATFDDLWIDWVVNDQEERLLEVRADARDHYATVVEDAGTWDLPKDLRNSMGSWKFEDAEAALALAGVVLDARDEIVSDAGDLDLTPPAELEELFEREGGLKAAEAEADLQLEVLADISVATERMAEKETILESIGLLGADPAADLEAARDAFEADELDDAGRDAERSLAERSGAAEAGQTRVLVAGGGVVLLTGVTIAGVRFRRGRRRAIASAVSAPTEPAQPGELEDEPLDRPA
ncbi:MAG: hypothetical protein WD402_08080 [Chloroflexota bacterium]